MKNVIIYAKNKNDGNEFSFTLNDLYGYEGEVCGVFISGLGIALNYNPGYDSDGMNHDIEIIGAKIIED